MHKLKISDLSVGDWVRWNNKTYCVCLIDGVSLTVELAVELGGTIEVAIDEVTGIPITPEILKKNGFVKEEDEDGNKRYSLIEGGTKFSLGYARSVFQWTFPIDVRYVHKLQHLLRFCGVEKEIEL